MLKILATIGKTIVVLLLLIVAGAVLFRQSEVVNLITNFYTTFSLETIVSLVIAGFVAGFYFLSKIDELSTNAEKKAKKEPKEKK